MQLESHGGVWRTEHGAYVWTPTKQKTEGRKCAQCGGLFTPRRTNHIYCKQACKTAAEKARERARKLAIRQKRHTAHEQEALKVGDYNHVRWLRAQRTKDFTELVELHDKGFMHELMRLLDYWHKKQDEEDDRNLKRWTKDPSGDEREIGLLTQSRHNGQGNYVPRHTWKTNQRARRKPAPLSDNLEIKNE